MNIYFKLCLIYQIDLSPKTAKLKVYTFGITLNINEL